MKTMRERATEILVSLTGRHEDAEPSAEDVLAAALESAQAAGVEEARRAALEEAARIADEAGDEFDMSGREEQATGAMRVAHRIRALTKKENE